MKSMNYFTTAIFVIFLAIGANALAQDSNTAAKGSSTIKTASFRVWGNCDMCKNRIETALNIEGVKKATWDKNTKTATVTYDPSKISIDTMQKKVASVGHDTEKYKAPDEVYSKLPACCQYDRKK
jgi:mercuric ion binding protein